jgi:hypothetical protein
MNTLKFIPFVLLVFLFSCKAEWTEDDKSRIIKDCKLSALKFGFTNPDQHCDCVLRKIIDRYPNPNQFENMEMGEFGEIVFECSGQEMSTRIIWPERTQKAFIDSCISMAKKEGSPNPVKFCPCVLDEIIRRYPTNDSLSKIKPSEMDEISKGCKTN